MTLAASCKSLSAHFVMLMVLQAAARRDCTFSWCAVL